MLPFKHDWLIAFKSKFINFKCKSIYILDTVIKILSIFPKWSIYESDSIILDLLNLCPIRCMQVLQSS